jgi:hypothetical protein
MTAQPPIIVVDGEDVAFYADVESVIRAIETVDLTDPELRIYDAAAAVLKPQTELLKRKLLGIFSDDVTNVVGLISDGSYDVEALTATLRRFIQYLRDNDDGDSSAGETLSVLLSEAVSQVGYSR